MARPLRQLGLNPADYRAMGGLAFELRVAARIDKWANEDEAERERIRNLPEVRERGEIERLYHSADKAEYGHGYQDYGLALSLRAQAKAKLEAWREKYPLAAREERNRELEAAAQHEESLASGALTYDADGWLSRSDQENSAKAHRQRAAELRSQIER